MSTSTKSLSVYQKGVRFGFHINERTARMFMQKLREVMRSHEDYPMTEVVNIDEYVVGGYEEGKSGRSYNSNKKKLYMQ